VLRLAGSLKLGVVQATAVMRTLQIGDSADQACSGNRRTRSYRQNYSRSGIH
jgi:hypothetical protein